MLKEVTDSSDGASALPSHCTGYGTAGAHEESECGRGDLCGRGGDECIRCKDLSSRLSRTTRKLLGWTRRVGIGAAASGRMLCPNRANALEKAICGFAENPGDNLIVSKLGTSFDLLAAILAGNHRQRQMRKR
ncbi:uncharacterized protein LOC119272795 [Triticum dicoccoides]|uniref:uncharacterized protein LOC119272795 n=1 Tax=Triticum dicoccoides TaxID=85692 RepID=UPI00188F4C94|nr:uncharacterized protein LOC119272795 [Triticum dicoccoides]